MYSFLFNWKSLSIFLTTLGLFGAFDSLASSQRQLVLNEAQIFTKYQQIQQILDRRCTVCHSCTESPCQLNLTTADHIRRGISKGQALETRFFQTEKTWPDTRKTFTSVLPRKDNESSLFLEALLVGNTSPNASTLRTARHLLKNETMMCPQNTEEYHNFLKTVGPVGMPLGLPSLPADEFQTLTEWLKEGAPLPSPEALATQRQSQAQKGEVQFWEDFLNNPSLERRLVARYIFEHMSLSHLVLNNHPTEFFELVRAENRSGFPIQTLRLNKSNSDPMTDKFYYRLSRVTSAPLRKTHLIWHLSQTSRNRFEQIFFAKPWKLPAKFKMKYSGNPFTDFAAIPAAARAQFMIENSQQIIDQMVRGPVCVGPTATYAIRDHFWVMFLDPKKDPSVLSPNLQKNEWNLPTPIITSLEKISDYQDEWMSEQKRLFPNGLELQQIWRGHPNSQLTIFRHSQNSSVHQGFIGQGAPTAWILSYSNFERLYYNLVVNFEPWDSSLSMLRTWKTMKEIRQEGEELFLLLLPEPLRDQVRRNWNTNAVAYQDLYLHKLRSLGYPSSIEILNTQEPVKELIGKLERQVFKVSSTTQMEELRQGIKVDNKAAWLPELSYLVITDRGHITQVSSLIKNRWFNNLLSPLQSQEDYHIKEWDRLSWLPGIYGSHPSMIFYVDINSLPQFMNEVEALRSSLQAQKLTATWGLKREHSDFWLKLDQLTDWMKKNMGQNGGLLDLGQYDL